MEFSDCNAYYGCDVRKTAMYPVDTISELDYEMKRAGVTKTFMGYCKKI
jgi:hypothetical protein